MRLVTFGPCDSPTPGVLVPLAAPLGAHTHVVDLVAAFASDGFGPPLTGGMRQLLTMSADGSLERARAAADDGRWRMLLAGVKLRAPISDPEKIICGMCSQPVAFGLAAAARCPHAAWLSVSTSSAVGMNYHDHCTEQNFPVPTEPVLFSKFASSITCDGAPIPFDEDLTRELDFEVELCIVVGKKARRVDKSHALEYIAGWTVAHDVSARDLQLKRNGGQWLLGKTGDGYSPIGPSIVTRDEGAAFADAAALGVRTFVNGQCMQDSNTRELVFKPADIIA